MPTGLACTIAVGARRAKTLAAAVAAAALATALATSSLACAWLPRSDEPTPTEYVPARTSTPLPPTSTPSPTPPSCPSPGSPTLPARPGDWIDYAEAARGYLSAGGSVGALEPLLASWDALPAESGQAVAADLTGDTNPEIVLAIRDPTSGYVFPSSGLYIFRCQDGAYVSAYEETVDGLGLQVIQVADADTDGVADVSYTKSTCGAHTCMVTLGILGWNGAGFADLMGGTLEMPYPTYTVSPGRIDAASGRVGSVGAEPQRDYYEIWQWNGSVFTVTDKIWGAPVYRYHALLDGDRALLNGDNLSAIGAYEVVISDDALQPFEAYYSAAEERAWLTAFAHWRLLLTFLRMGDNASAQTEYNLLLTEYTPGSPGYEVAVMAETFWTAYGGSVSLSGGCAAVVAAAGGGDPVLAFFNSYGYANPAWEPADLCPF
jgi:hypothetical protein